MSTESFEVNFGQAFPLFPLEGVTLMPHGIRSLHLFEPRYRQLITDIMEGSRQFATATFDGDKWQHEYHGRPPLRPAVCIVQIMQHAEFDDQTHGVIVQGICRARITNELPADGRKLYRRAKLEPLELVEPDEELLTTFRERIAEAMEHDRLSDLRGAKSMVEHLRNEEIPASTIFEVLGFNFLSDDEVRYRLLASDDARERAAIVSTELLRLQSMLRRAQPQRNVDTPKGCHWN